MKSLKKIVSAIAVTGMFTALISGCGKETGDTTTGTTTGTPINTNSTAVSEDSAAISVMDLKDISQYVTIDNYTNMTIDLGVSYKVGDDMVDQYASYYYSYAANYVNKESFITDRAVEDGDVTHIDYTGYKDGEAFEGGSTDGEGTILWIGSNSYIEGFESGLVGVMPGDTIDLNLTFPEEYGNADLAGAEVVFTVTVNGIVPSEKIIEQWNSLNSSDAADYTDIENYYRDGFEKTVADQKESDIEGQIYQTLIAQATFKQEFPASLIYQYQGNASNILESYASQYGYDIDTIAQMMLGTTADDYIVNISYEQIQLAAVCRYIAEQENIVPSEQDVHDRACQYLIELGYDDPETVIATADMREFELTFIQEDVRDFVKKTAKITTLDD